MVLRPQSPQGAEKNEKEGLPMIRGGPRPKISKSFGLSGQLGGCSGSTTGLLVSKALRGDCVEMMGGGCDGVAFLSVFLSSSLHV